MKKKTKKESDYFIKNSVTINLFGKNEAGVGLRKAQSGALYSVLAHFTTKSDPAIVVLPTGSGKSIILMLSAYLLEPKRVLVVTPGILLRDQIYEDFAKLTSLKRYQLIHKDVIGPNIKEVKTKLSKKSDWKELLDFDVVVATPNCISPKEDNVETPPDDLFDLILVDEAHHSAAKSWQALLDCFPKAKKVLFTATPFRNDRKELKGSFSFVYPIRRAFEDKIFGNISFVPVTVNGDENVDVAVAKATEIQFLTDKKENFEHYLVVRTDSLKKAEELGDIYSKNTSLNLRIVNSKHSFRHIKSTIKQLREGRLDGVIAVSMLGEGFDFPNLKIAAIHAPHKSLPVTLQFIGRFARTGDASIGDAKFLAVPNEIKIESEKLYKEDIAWKDIVTNLVQTQVQAQVKLKEDLQSFEIENDETLQDKYSPYSLKPGAHVKIYRTFGAVNLSASMSVIQSKDVVSFAYSEATNSSYFICKKEDRPLWSDEKIFSRIEFEFHFLYFDPTSNLLFICSSDRSFALYEELVKNYSPEGHRILPLSEINRVLRGMSELEFFNIGMKSAIKGGKTESYRIISGPSTQNSVSALDGALFNRGHIVCKGNRGLISETIGYSSSSKVWSMAPRRIPELVEWCKNLSKNIQDTTPFSTKTNIEFLQVGKVIEKIENEVMFCDWNAGHLMKGLTIEIQGAEKYELLDVPLEVFNSDNSSVIFGFNLLENQYQFKFSITDKSYFSNYSQNAGNISILEGKRRSSLIDFFNASPISMYLPDFSRLSGSELFAANTTGVFEIDKVFSKKWNDVLITAEVPSEKNEGSISVQEHSLMLILEMDYDVIFLDDGSGEIADFVCLKFKDPNTLIVSLYHLKASQKPQAGARIKDLYEVCGQATKSCLRFNQPIAIVDRLIYRSKKSKNSEFKKGDIVYVENLRKKINNLAMDLKVTIVQPGVERDSLTDEMKTLLVATQTVLQRFRNIDFQMWFS